MTSVARELGGLAGGAGTGALAGLAIGGPMGAGPGATIGGLGGLIGGSILGSKKILEDRHARGEPLYGEREDDLKAQAISNPNQTNYYGSE
jgi:outer membrane lipoprotein SlyB